MKTIDSERALELMSELRNEYDESFDIGMPPQTDQYEANMMRILNVCLMCFLILIVLISLANIANTITTAVRLRTRELCDDKSSRLQQVHIFKNDFRGEFKLYASRLCDRRADGRSGKL